MTNQTNTINTSINVDIANELFYDGNSVIVVTHSGTFHGDEVVAVAIISLVYPNKMIYLTRTRDKDMLEEAKCDPYIIVVDVGGHYDPSVNNFDHHQKSFSEYREDGVVKYSSAGLVWKKYGHLIKDVNDFVYFMMDQEVMKPVDAVDNGIEGYDSPISNVISSFNPTWEDESQEAENRGFLAAVKVARDYLENKIRFYKGLANAKKIIDNGEVIDGNILVLPRFAPWQRYVTSDNKYNEILYVVFPDKSGAWRVQAVPPEPESFGMRKPLPESWRGLREDNLRDLTGVKTAVFCHPAGFIAGAETMQDAIELAKLAVAS